jgi:hypothetical protein
MATLPELQDRLEKLRTQRASGASEVQSGDWRVAYRSDREVAAAIVDLERQIASITTTPVTTILVAGSKGLETS